MRAIDYRYNILVIGSFFIFCDAQVSLYPMIKDRKSISRSDEAFNSFTDSLPPQNVRHYSPYGHYENPEFDVLRYSPYKLKSNDDDVPTLHQGEYEEINPIERTAIFRVYNKAPPPPDPGKEPKKKPPRVIEIFGQNDVVDFPQVVAIGFNVVGLIAIWILILWFMGWDTIDVLMGDNFNWKFRQLQEPPSLTEGGPAHEIISFLSNIIKKMDYVDMAFSTFGVTDKECINLAICKMRQYLHYTPLVNILVDNVGLDDMSLLKNYKHAMDIGMNNTSCENMFDLCQSSSDWLL